MPADNVEGVIKLTRRQVVQGLQMVERQRSLIQRLSELSREPEKPNIVSNFLASR